VIDFKSRQEKSAKQQSSRMSFSVLPLLGLMTILVPWKSVSLKLGQGHRKEGHLYSLRVVGCKSIRTKSADSVPGHHLTLSFCLHSYGPGESTIVVVNEDSPLPDPGANARSARLINAEKEVLKHGGGCLRLAGLYAMDRGAHNFWLTSGKDASGREDGIINLLHYDDAAGAALAALLAGPTVVSGNIFLISDGNPLTRRQICESTLKSKQYRGKSVPKFLGSDSDPIGKIYDGSASNKALKWDPKYESFDFFMASNA
jgi:hypothetical protein